MAGALFLAMMAVAGFGQSNGMGAQAYRWKNVKVMAGGFIPGIVFNTSQPGLAYCRTDIGSSYKWDSQTKKWMPLTDWCGVGNLHGSESIATDALDPNRVYIAAGMGPGQPAAMLRSMDQGRTFQVVDVPFTMGGNSPGRGVGERLAIDPNDNDILYFGSRSAGLWVSKDAALTWKKVESFPPAGAFSAGNPVNNGLTNAPGLRAQTGGAPAAGGEATAGARRGRGGGGRSGGAGLSFVVFDAGTGRRGQPTQTIYVGSTERGDHHLFRSTDAGRSWQPVPGQPAVFAAIHAGFDTKGILYLVYDNGVGPGGVTDGAVWKYNPKDGAWTDITPVKDANRFPGGYGGMGIDRQNPGTVVVASLNRKDPSPGGDDDDRIYRTTDGGQSWQDISPKSHRDSSASPYVVWVGKPMGDLQKQPEASVGWWIATLAIDPFDSKHVCYATGATIWNTEDMTSADSGGDTHWSIWADGIEETAIIDLASPPAGAHLISAFGDIGGFTHDDLDATPAQGMHLHPLFTTGSSLDFAENNPNVVIRTGNAALHMPDRDTMAYSLDGGHSWKAFTTGGAAGGGRRGGGGGQGGGVGTGPVILSADGSVFMSTAGTPRISTDKGATWKDVQGLPSGARPVADRSNPAKFYALDLAARRIYMSTDGGATFAATNEVAGLPETGGDASGFGRGGGLRLVAVPARQGDLWLVGRQGLYHSSDAGRSFKEIARHPPITGLSFGQAAPGKDYPAIYVANGDQSGGPAAGLYRSDDQGATWVRINDASHQWGNRFRCIAGDPRIYGRVYVGTDGRGIVFGDIAN
ncbi:MAG TPA: hypothetical protein VN765_05275 [Candidatus Acidoferrum sp.]|nr:hypothetical protein [Candidatus Acidoferrum sp.]